MRLLTSVFIATAISGCSSEPSNLSPSETQGVDGKALIRGQKVLTEADNGITVRIPEGIDLAVHLKSKPSAGYSWVVTETNPGLGKGVSSYQPSTSGLLGADRTQVILWSWSNAILPVGVHQVKLEYRRFNGEVAGAFSFTVEIYGGPR